MKKDIIDMLFEKKDDYSMLDFKTKERNELNSKIAKLDDKINAFIDNKIHPNSRKELENLLFEYNVALTKYHEKGRLLLYRAGFIDGVNSIMIPLSNK